MEDDKKGKKKPKPKAKPKVKAKPVKPRKSRAKPKPKPEPVVEVVDAEVVEVVEEQKTIISNDHNAVVNEIHRKYIIDNNGMLFGPRAIAIRDGIQSAIIRKYGSIDAWYDRIVVMAHNNPRMINVLLDVLYKPDPEPQVVNKLDQTGNNVIRLGYKKQEQEQEDGNRD